MTQREASSLRGSGNQFGQLGLGTRTQASVPTQVDNRTSWWTIAAGGYVTKATTSDGKLWAWGRNENGQIGDGTTTNQLLPEHVGAGVAAVAVGGYHTVAAKADGTLWTWGDNSLGQLGNGTTTGEFTLIQVFVQ
jgi:alpha-tubulin suppressor-like RCC1 family protein